MACLKCCFGILGPAPLHSTTTWYYSAQSVQPPRASASLYGKRGDNLLTHRISMGIGSLVIVLNGGKKEIKKKGNDWSQVSAPD